MNPNQTIALYQPLLQTIAYNLVRCKADAEDIVQETFLKWLSIEQQGIKNTKAYLIKAVTNNSINHITSAKRKKTVSLTTTHIPDFLYGFKEINVSKIDLDVDLKAAFKTLHSKLEPLERAVFILKEVFDIDYDALQQMLNKRKDHCRQLLSRAKKKLSEESPKIHVDFPDTAKIIGSFKQACTINNISEFVQELKNDIFSAICHNP